MTFALHRKSFCAAAAALSLAACAPEIGDACQTSLDCSSQGSRLCDRTQPGGYCTLRGCEQGTCPDEAVCVKFRPMEERLATTWCMAKCDGDGDCRTDEGYRCTTAEGFSASGLREAEILGRPEQRFCGGSVTAPEASDETMQPPLDAGRSDGGVDAVMEP